MNRILFFLSVLVFFQSCKQDTNLPRVAVAGLAIESSTFSPARTHEEDFRVLTGMDVLDFYPTLHRDSINFGRAEWFPSLKAKAIPGGMVTREAYESLVNKTLEMLEENLPYDGLYLELHGAMSVEGLDDPEADYAERVRRLVGKQTLISTCMDLHGNVSERLLRAIDIFTCYRLAPHEDAMESKERAIRTLLMRLENGKGKPAYKARVRVPILLPGEKTSTRIEPAKSLYARVAPATAQDGILDASIWVGYPWADEPRNHAVIVVTGDDREKVKSAAEELAAEFWRVRNEFRFVAPTAGLQECLDKAIASDKKPYFISDMGDNPTAGGAGDVSWTLRELLAHDEFKDENGKALIYASIPGPELIEKAVKAGVGGYVEAYVGAITDNRYAPPVLLSGRVEAIRENDPIADTEVLVKTGSLQVIVTKKRKPYHYESDFTNLGLDPRNTDIVMVKIGYLVPELYTMQKGWIMALTPGGVDQNLERLDYRRLIRPIFPLDKDMEDPDLTAEIYPAEF